MSEGIFFWQCLRPGLSTSSPASLLLTHFGLFVSIPIAFASAAATHIVMPRMPTRKPKPAKECRCLCLRKPSADKPAR